MNDRRPVFQNVKLLSVDNRLQIVERRTVAVLDVDAVLILP